MHVGWQVILRMSKELPLVVEYRIQDMGNLSFYLVRLRWMPPRCSVAGALIVVAPMRMKVG